jgi:Tfp pilus assembly pilus retraction ATPase PilT
LESALESSVRQALNIILVGEVRNASDMHLVLDLAQMGHLVVTTLHCQTVGASIPRIVEMFSPDQERKIRELLATYYRMGLAQVLVKGVHGQIELAMDIMKTCRDVKDLIIGKQEVDRLFSMREIMELHASVLGTQSLDQSLVSLHNQGRINEDAVVFNSPDVASLIERQLKLGVRLSSKWDPTGARIEGDLETVKLSIDKLAAMVE